MTVVKTLTATVCRLSLGLYSGFRSILIQRLCGLFRTAPEPPLQFFYLALQFLRFDEFLCHV